MRRALALLLTLGLLAGCVGAGDGGPPEGAPGTGAVIPGGAIATAALPPPSGPLAGAAAVVAAEPASAPDPAAAAAPAADPATAAGPVAGVPAAPPVAEPPPSRDQLRCERRGGTWSRVIPGSDARACIFRTRDSGRRCDAGTDCQGECLARSGTCAPVMPLFGCQEILDDTGRRMTQCIE